jgi:hypothetical protein
MARHMKPTVPQIPDVARSLLKAAIGALANTGLITSCDAAQLVAILGLGGCVSRYRKLDVRLWNDTKFRALSDNGKLAFIFTLTHPGMTMIGAMRATIPEVEVAA